MSRRFVSEADEAQGYALACRLLPGGDLTLGSDPPPQERETRPSPSQPTPP
jgi:hypothetical protein